MKVGKKRERRSIQGWTDLSDMKDLHKGAKCFICGAGPSIGFLNLEGIHDHVVIAVNSAALLMPWRDGSKERRFWVSNDVLCMRWDYFTTHVCKFNSTKLVRTSWKKYHGKIDADNFRYFAPRLVQTHPLDPTDTGLCSVSSVPTAIDLALLLGCKSIYLLGVDHRLVHGNSHFWQFWSRLKWPTRTDKGKNFRPAKAAQENVFVRNKPVFQALSCYASSMECEIYNCSIRTKLDMFPIVPLEEALGE